MVIAGANDTPVEISKNVVSKRKDIETNHEEAEHHIIQLVLQRGWNAELTVVCDDTDMFVLLLHYYHKAELTNTMLMESPIKGRIFIDIAKTVEKQA